MASRKSGWKSILVATGALLSAALLAQSPGDFPSLNGGSDRTGHNGNPAANGSGRTRLRWFDPSGIAATRTLTIDNTDFVNTSGLPGGPYDANPYGVVTATAGWGQPALSEEATVPYVLPRRKNPIGFFAQDLRERSPSYYYSTCVASDLNDPTKAAFGTAQYFEWKFVPPSGTERSYAVSVWLPIGGTVVSGKKLFTQRYFVYEVTYGSGQKFVDIVDTSLAGFGFVRLGNGGASSNVVFPSDGTPITVRLYNTVPRDANGQLRLDASDPTPSHYLVYADAVQAVPKAGIFDASPTSASFGSNTNLSVVSALTQVTSSVIGGIYTPIQKGVVTSYEGNMALWTNNATPRVNWRYSPLEESNLSVNMDNIAAQASPLWVAETTNPFHQGSNYLDAPVVLDTTPTSSVTYAPTMEDGDYEIYAYVPGDNGTEKYGHAVEYQIIEGNVTTFGVMDQSQKSGWLKLGTRRYTHSKNSLPLKVVITNGTSLTYAADITAGRKAYADAVRFVVPKSIAIKSTPVNTMALIKKSDSTIVDTKVVIVADEAGKIHCLDATGNGDGTTTEYWSYPSTADLTDTTWVDPNLSEGIDGVVNPSITPPRDNVAIAKMPQQFDISSALVKRINGADYLYIGASNGRVYCIDMTGRGDYVTSSHKIGSTKRVWTFPDDYPNTAIQKDGIGALRGSVVFGDTADGAPGPTVFVPASEGRIYALNALGNGDATHTTSVRWQFPSATSVTLPPIEMTPSLAFNRLYFGTLQNQNQDGVPGTFYALNLSNGQVSWKFDGTNAGSTVVSEYVSDFITGPTTVPGAMIDAVNSGTYPGSGLSPSPHPNVVYVLNHNRYLYGFVAETGALLQSTDGRNYRTNELGVVSTANLGFTVITTADRNQNARPFPVVTIPGADGFLYFMFARAGDYNIYSDASNTFRQARYIGTRGPMTTTPAFSNGWLYITDSDGFISAFNEDPNNEGVGTGGDLPVNPGNDTNNPGLGEVFTHAKITFMKPLGYQALRTITSSNEGQLTYSDATTNSLYTYGFNPLNPMGFELGETAYIMVYGFPYLDKNTGGKTVPPPTVNVTISLNGVVLRQVPVDTHKFNSSGVSPNITQPPGTGLTANGYAVIPFTFQPSGPNQVPPGDGEIRVNITSAGADASFASQEYMNDPRNKANFYVANPLGLRVFDFNGANATNPGLQIGANNDGSLPENRANGSPNIAGSSYLQAQLVSTPGFVNHGKTESSVIALYDRSLMVALTGRGITNLRMERSNLQWQGGASTVYRGLDSFLYPRYEDVPSTFPNRSLDYPNIGRENIRFTKDPTGNAENPLLTEVSLNPPLNSSNKLFTDGDDKSLRKLIPTFVNISFDVPKYQPGPDVAAMLNLGTADLPDDFTNLRHDSLGRVPTQGYFGHARAFLNSGNGQFTVGGQQPYRSFNMSLGIVHDFKILIQEPTLDLGTLASGAGYSPAQPFGPAGWSGAFNPITGVGDFKAMYKSFNVLNDGNTNLLNVRLAKAWIDPQVGYTPWTFGSAQNDRLAALDGLFDLHSNLDPEFAPQNPKQSSNTNVILQKPRVTDTGPTALSVNPIIRSNSNLGVTGGSGLVPGYPLGAPLITTSIPLGFPVGTYSENIRVIDDWQPFKGWQSVWQPTAPGGKAYEPYSDPTLKLSFTVTETRLTSGRSSSTAPMYDTNSFDPSVNKFVPFNAQPAGMRDGLGSLIVAFTSNRLGFDGTQPTTNPFSRLSVGTVANAGSFAGGLNVPTNNFYGYTPTGALRDLNFFLPDSNNSWFHHAVESYPSDGQVANAFPLAAGEAQVAKSSHFESPVFPAKGMFDPLNPSGPIFDTTLMAFTGGIQKSTDSGRVEESKVFVATARTAAGGSVTLGDPVAVREDPLTKKGRPSIVSFHTGGNLLGLVFYPVTSAGQTTIHASRLGTNAVGTPITLDFGNGFSSVSGPSAGIRNSNSGAVIDLTFTGRLKGRPNAEVYMSRLNFGQQKSDAEHVPFDSNSFVANALNIVDASGFSGEVSGAGTPFQYLPQQTNERLLSEGNGVYRARGVLWNLRAVPDAAAPNDPVQLLMFLADGTSRNLLAGNKKVDPQSGIISYDSQLGGKVFLDPSQGTVRFSVGIPQQKSEIRLTYTPVFLRVTEGNTSGYTTPTTLFDDRIVSDLTYWYQANGNYATVQNNIRNDRFNFFYGRSAAGNSQTTRPYMSSMRFGVRLPSKVATGQGGVLQFLKVTGNVGPYQVDPSNNRIYFSAADENSVVTVSYRGVDDAGQALPNPLVITAPVSFVLEKGEEPILISGASNESNLSVFLDPFTYQSSGNNDNRRPPLVWMFYTSTRNGSPDIYFQTIAPRYAPVIAGQ